MFMNMRSKSRPRRSPQGGALRRVRPPVGYQTEVVAAERCAEARPLVGCQSGVCGLGRAVAAEARPPNRCQTIVGFGQSGALGAAGRTDVRPRPMWSRHRQRSRCTEANHSHSHSHSDSDSDSHSHSHSRIRIRIRIL